MKPPPVPEPSARARDVVAEVHASERLARSRARLRRALLAIAHPPPQPSLFADGIGNVGSRLLDRIKSLPMATAVLEGVEAWWRKHPLRRAANAAEAASQELLGPIARRQPATLIALAVGCGILLAYAKPWRWLLRPTNLLSAVTEVGRSALRSPSAKAWTRGFRQGAASASNAGAS